MDSKYCLDKRNELLSKISSAKCDIIYKINNSDVFKNLDKKYLIQRVREMELSECKEYPWKLLITAIHEMNYPDDLNFYFDSRDKFVNDTLGFGKLFTANRYLSAVKNIEDSDWVEFDGDVVITDPCYTTNEWCNGFELDSLPLCRDTIYGDWGCTTYNTDTKKELGIFCADAGMVCVDTLDKILERKPDFIETCGDWCYTLIPHFKGIIRFEIVCIDEKGEKEEFNIWNYEVRVVGHGINKETGEKLDFYTTQTGL